MATSEVQGLTLADLEAMPADGRRHELVGGVIVVNAAPTPRHQRACGRLLELLQAARPAGHEVFIAPLDVDLPFEQRVEPDLVVAPHSSVGDTRITGPVLLVVELVSPTSVVWDTVSKRAAYEATQIEHYWMVDTRPGDERFTALRLRDGSYDVAFESTSRIDVIEPVAVSVPLAALFDPPTDA